MRKVTGIVLVLALLVAIVPHVGLAQGAMQDMQGSGSLANQTLRGYTHMFIAYFIAWAIIFGWVVSIARRLARVEKALKD